jgi:hypothetical protein
MFDYLLYSIGGYLFGVVPLQRHPRRCSRLISNTTMVPQYEGCLYGSFLAMESVVAPSDG